MGSVEIKAAWLATDQLRALYTDKEIHANFYTRKAMIKADSKTISNTEVALIGMHVVGVVENHPEFIWATFEHHTSAPDYYGSPGTFKKVTTPYEKNKIVSSDDKFIFYRKNTTAGNANLSYPAEQTTTNTFRLYQFGVPNGAPYTNVASSDQQTRDAENFNNIQVLNNSVKQGLTKHDSRWQHYFYAGSVWLSTQGYKFNEGISGNIVPPNANDKLRGSLALANITMETYTQTYGDPNQNKRYSTNNCFACHAPAREPWDFICESDHGCDAIPIDHKMTGALQRSDPSCGEAVPESGDWMALFKLKAMVSIGLTKKWFEETF